jgi:hypothetical protein
MPYKKPPPRGQTPERRELTLDEVRQKISSLDQEIDAIEVRRKTLVFARMQWKVSLAQRLRHSSKA